MQFVPERLEALVAIVDEGTFDAAARRLHVTPSAISQRIRALESEVGQVLLRRASPCTPTPAGEPLVRLGRQLRLLEREATLAVPGAEATVVELAVAVNADSLATWFRELLGEVAAWDGVALQLAVEDQEYADRLLRRGEVIAAVTSNPTPVQGCTTESLGQMRYVPAATPRLVERFSEKGDFAWGRAPVVVFNDKDHLQDKALAAGGHERPPVVHRVPTSAEFHEAVRCGLGWVGHGAGSAVRTRSGIRHPAGDRGRCLDRGAALLAALAVRLDDARRPHDHRSLGSRNAIVPAVRPAGSTTVTPPSARRRRLEDVSTAVDLVPNASASGADLAGPGATVGCHNPGVTGSRVLEHRRGCSAGPTYER